MAFRPRTEGDPWRGGFPASKPIRTDNGIATRKQRGAMAESWWSGRLTELLDSYGLGGRMERGRRYARQGQLVSFAVEPGAVNAQVQGSRRDPYDVTVRFARLTDPQWEEVQRAIESTLQIPARLLAGEVPAELESVFERVGVDLLPRRWTDLDASCSCPDFGNPCKHIAAVLYVLADKLDDDPWLLLEWRGRTRSEVLAHLGTTADGRAEVAPWWPLVPGAPLPVDGGAADSWNDDGGSASLARLGPLELDVRSQPVVDRLVAAYRVLGSNPSPE